jgi:hypothetical protein
MRSTILALMLALQLAAGSVEAAEFNLDTATIEDINKAFDAGALNSEKLVQLYLDRIAAYDKSGPRINAIITLNQAALATARSSTRNERPKDRAAHCTGYPSSSRISTTPKTCRRVAASGHSPTRGRCSTRPSWHGCAPLAPSFLPRST